MSEIQSTEKMIALYEFGIEDNRYYFENSIKAEIEKAIIEKEIIESKFAKSGLTVRHFR